MGARVLSPRVGAARNGAQRRSSIAVLALVAMGVSSPAALAQTAEAPQWKVGYKWTFQSVSGLPPVTGTWQREVIESLPDGKFSVQMENGNKLTFDGETNSLDSRGPEYSWKRFDFPLHVGKQWTHERKLDAYGRETATWKVKAYESVTVPAGTFDCFRVEGVVWQTRNYMMYAPSTSHEDFTYWYCPDVKWVARWKSHRASSQFATHIDSESVLTSFVGER